MSNELTASSDYTSLEAIKAREDVYDQQIKPLMDQMAGICLANNIAMMATMEFGKSPSENQTDLVHSFYFPRDPDDAKAPCFKAFQSMEVTAFLRKVLHIRFGI
jgi:hypothetical protein